MPPRPIELVRVEGTHREVGVQIGTATAAVVRRHADAVDPGRLAQAVGYRDATAAELPWLIEELDGVAEGAGADPLAVFAASIEEIWADAAVPAGRCSDLVGCGPATADGHVWVGHCNDLGPESRGRADRPGMARGRRSGLVHDRRRARGSASASTPPASP